MTDKKMTQTLTTDQVEEILALAKMKTSAMGKVDMVEVLATQLLALRKRVAELEGALTPSAATKAAYIGEFSFNIEVWEDEAGEDGEGAAVMQQVTVPWTTTKEIMAAIRAFASHSPKEPS